MPGKIYHAAGALAIAFSSCCFAVQAGGQTTQVEIDALIRELDSDDFDSRESAVSQLIAAGLQAVSGVGKVALEGSPEARFRAVTVLSAMSRFPDEETAEAANQALLKVAASGDAASAKQAQTALEPFARLEKMRGLAESFALYEADGEKSPPRLPVSKKPVHRFVDTQRGVLDGTVWTFGDTGRPRAMIEVYSVGSGRGELTWHSAVVSLTSNGLTAENVDGDEKQKWTSGSWGQEFAPLPRALPPSNDEERRGAAMAQLALRFSAHQFWQPGLTRYELEGLPRPIGRYKDEKAGILDGGIFVFAHETNPEVLLLIEAQKIDGVSRWVFALAPLGSARMHVQLDEDEVWTCATPPNVVGGGTHPYWAFSRKSAPDGK